jgi:hypothetical protein
VNKDLKAYCRIAKIGPMAHNGSNGLSSDRSHTGWPCWTDVLVIVIVPFFFIFLKFLVVLLIRKMTLFARMDVPRRRLLL